MSEYQYYEFQAIDKHLSAEEQKELSNLSSRAVVSASKASFVYNYSDFPADPLDVLTKSFDALFYISNWGSTRLAFYFPNNLIDEATIDAYCDEEFITLSRSKEGLILDLNLYEEESYRDWVDGENWLDSLVLLRQAILQGDYRVLYLAWLKRVSDCSYDENYDDIIEPEVPTGLQTLTSELNDFVKIFDIKHYLIQATAKVSDAHPDMTDWAFAIKRLSREECDSFLIKLLEGTANIDIVLKNRLELLSHSTSNLESKKSLRSFNQIRQDADNLKSEASKAKDKQRELKKIKELKQLSTRENQVWKHIDNLIQQAKSKPYKTAIELLLQLRELSIYEQSQGKQEAEMIFKQKLEQKVIQPYQRKTSLKRLLIESKLL